MNCIASRKERKESQTILVRNEPQAAAKKSSGQIHLHEIELQEWMLYLRLSRSDGYLLLVLFSCSLSQKLWVDRYSTVK